MSQGTVTSHSVVSMALTFTAVEDVGAFRGGACLDIIVFGLDAVNSFVLSSL